MENENYSLPESSSSFISAAIQQQIQNLQNQVSEEDPLDFEPLAVYFGEDYIVNENIKIRQPTIMDYIKLGENNIRSAIAPFVTTPTSIRVQLWDKGIDWCTITKWQLFSMLIKTLDIKYTQVIFGEIDFSSFDLCNVTIDETLVQVLYSTKHDFVITEDDYNKMFKYLCYMFNVVPKEQKTFNKRLKQELIDNDRLKMLSEQVENQGKPSSPLLSMVSFALNHPGFKYKKSELKDIGIIEFMDSIKRLQIYENTRALIQGNYSGMCDLSKVDRNNFNFMRNTDE